MAFINPLTSGIESVMGNIPVAVPAGFGWTPSFNIYRVSPGQFATDIVESSLRPSTSRNVYVDYVSGNNANLGTDPNAPKKSIWAALNLSANDTIYVKAGSYPDGDGWEGITPIFATCVIGVTDFVTLAPGRVIINKTGGVSGKLGVNVTLFIQNLTFIGGLARAFFAADGSVVAIDCDFYTSDTLENFTLNSNIAAVTHNITLIRCRSLNAGQDGFGATLVGIGEACRWVEINCIATKSGRFANTDQGSSHHKIAANGAVNCIRINGHYYDNYGPQNIADVGGVLSWNLGVSSYRVTGGGNDCAFYCGDAGTMWLDSCNSGGRVDLQTDNAAGTIKLKNTPYQIHTGPGTVTTY